MLGKVALSNSASDPSPGTISLTLAWNSLWSSRRTFQQKPYATMIRINHVINEHLDFRGCFCFTLTQVFYFFCFTLDFRILKDSSEKQLSTGKTKNCSDSLLAFKHQSNFQIISSTVGFNSMSNICISWF